MSSKSAEPANALLAASQWYALLSSGEATAEDLSAWETWQNADTANQEAWQRVENVTRQLEKLPPGVRAETFSKLPSAGRRDALKNLVILLGIGSGSFLLYQHKPWREFTADYATATGEIREVALDDGSRMFINTASLINVKFSAEQRLIELLKGEVLIHTAQEPGPYRPLLVSTRHGTATALGTKFSVRLLEQSSQVSVTEGSVRVAPAHGNAITLHAGEATHFDTASHGTISTETSSAWTKGMLVAYSMPLGEFIAELARYRSGILRCDPEVSQLQVSGTFFTADTDAVLENLTRILPLRLETHTRYWVILRAA